MLPAHYGGIADPTDKLLQNLEKSFSPGLINLVRKCSSYDSADRPGLEELQWEIIRPHEEHVTQQAALEHSLAWKDCCITRTARLPIWQVGMPDPGMMVQDLIQRKPKRDGIA